MLLNPLSAFPITVTLPVCWGDMDAFGHVNNVVFFKYFEAGRIDYLAKVGWFNLKDETGHGPIVQSTTARFRKPLTHPDSIRVGVRVVELQTDRVVMEHAIWSEHHKAMAADGQVIVVNYDYSAGVKADLPEELMAAILALEEIYGNVPTCA